MTNEIRLIGEWFLPSNSEQRFAGTLLYQPQEGITLWIYGSFNGLDIYQQKEEKIILGITDIGQEITLYDCLVTEVGSASMDNNKNIHTIVTYSPNYLLQGGHIYTEEQLVFNQISAEIFNLDEWLGVSGFISEPHIESLRNQETIIRYKRPVPIEFEINTETKGRFNFIIQTPQISRYNKSQEISQKVEIQIESLKEKSINDLRNYLYKFQNFLSLALYRNTYLLSVSLTGKSHTQDNSYGNQVKKDIRLYFLTRSIATDEKPKMDFQMLFHYSHIEKDFPSIIQTWYTKYELLEPAFNLLFEQFYNQSPISENTFLNLAQSAETFHARMHNRTKLPSDEYKKIKDDILVMIPVEKKYEWVKDLFNFGNNLTLHDRLTELVERYSNKILDEILEDKAQFVQEVKYSRNYYTHYSKSLEKKALKGIELFYLSEKLKLLLICCFLMETGFDKELLSSNMDRVKLRIFSHLINRRK